MRIGKIAQTVLFGIAIIATIYAFTEGMNQYNEIRNLMIRNLALDQSKIKKICEKADFTNGISNYILNLTKPLANSTTTTISNSINSKNSTDAQGLIDFIKNGKQEDLTNYIIKRVSPYIVYLAFAVISIISWLVYFLCCCCPCCCCSPKGCCCDGQSCPNFSVFLALISYLGIIACCIIGFIFSLQFVKDVNSVTCQFLTFYTNTIDGQNVTTTPKWVGVNGIKKIFSDTNSALDKIAQNSRTAFGNTNWTKTDPDNFESLLSSTYDKFKDRSLTNRNPALTKKTASVIVPLYISNYGAYTKQNTLLNIIYQEFSTKIKYSITLVDQAKDYSKTVSDNIQNIKDTINSIDTSLQPLSDTFTTLEKDVLSQWIDYQITVNDNAVNGFLIIFAVLAGISLFSIFLMIFYISCCKVQWFRFCLHFFWIIIMILMVLTFILGTVLGVIGIVSTDGVSVLKWVLGPDNLLSASPMIITDKTSAKYVNICFNGNGDLANEAFGTSSNAANYLDRLYNVSNTLIDTRDQISNNKNSLAITSINSQLDNQKKNILLTTDTSYNSDSLEKVFSEWNSFTDSSISGTYQRSCSSYTKDYWVSDSKTCPATYNYLQAGSVSIGTPSCLVLSEWSAAQVASRYSASPSGCGSTGSNDFATISSASNTYFSAMNSYSSENSKLIDEIKTEHTKINSSFESMAVNLLDLLGRVDGIISPLVVIFNTFVGNNGLFSFINCSYMGTNIKDLLIIMNDQLAVSSNNLGAVIIAASFLEFVSVFSILIVILRKRNTGELIQNSPDKHSKDVEFGIINQ